MNPMLKRRLHLATFFVLIPLALVVTIFWVLTWLFRLVTPLTSLVTAVVNGVRSWTLTNSDSHHHMTSMTLAPHQPTTNTATTTLHHWSSTECGIGMILLITLLVCVSIIASRSLGKIPIDVTHLYTWKRSQSLDKMDDSATVCSSSPALPSSKKPNSETTSPPLQPLEFSTGIIPSSHDVQSPIPTSIVEMPTSSPVISTRTDDLSDGTQPAIAEEPMATTMTTTASPNTTTIDKRRKKRNKHLKKKDRGKRMSTAEQQSSEQQQQQQQQATRTKPGDSTTTQKMSVKTSQQSTILVPPSPPSPCDDRESSTLSLGSTPPTVPPSTGVTQKHFSVKSAPTPSTNNRSPPSPSVSPNDRHRPSITPTKEQSTISGSPASTPALHQPMVTKLISNKKDSHPPPSSSSTSTKAFTSFPSTPSPPSSSTTTTAPTTSSITGRQSWYSPFNTGLEFDLLSRSPPSPTHTYVSTSSSSSPSLSTSSTSFNQNDYRLFTDPPSSRPPPPPPLPSIGGYNSHLQQQQQLQQQTQQIHQLHQYPSHSHSHHHATLPLQHYQHRHPQIQQHHHFQQPSQLNPIVGGSTYDQLFYGTLPTPTPPSSSTEKATGMHMESSSSIADLPPPPTNARLPTPPVSLSPVITPPNMPPPSSSSSFASTGEPSSSSTFPFSLWYPWKSRSGVGGQSPTLHHHQQPQQQESIYPGNVGTKDEHGSASFSLFDRKLSFQSGGSSRSHGASQH